MLVTGLPIPIIANNFSLYYTVSKLKKRLDEREELKRVTSTEVINTMKNIMNKVNPIDRIKGFHAMDKIKGMNFNPVNRVKGLVTNSKQHSENTSAGQSAQTSLQGTPVVPRREDSQTRVLALPPIKNEGDDDVEAQHSQEDVPKAEAGISGPPHHLPPLTTVEPRNSTKPNEASVNVDASNA